jgi:hypothetical protein
MFPTIHSRPTPKACCTRSKFMMVRSVASRDLIRILVADSNQTQSQLLS